MHAEETIGDVMHDVATEYRRVTGIGLTLAFRDQQLALALTEGWSPQEFESHLQTLLFRSLVEARGQESFAQVLASA